MINVQKAEVSKQLPASLSTRSVINPLYIKESSHAKTPIKSNAKMSVGQNTKVSFLQAYEKRKENIAPNNSINNNKYSNMKIISIMLENQKISQKYIELAKNYQILLSNFSLLKKERDILYNENQRLSSAVEECTLNCTDNSLSSHVWLVKFQAETIEHLIKEKNNIINLHSEYQNAIVNNNNSIDQKEKIPYSSSSLTTLENSSLSPYDSNSNFASVLGKNFDSTITNFEQFLFGNQKKNAFELTQTTNQGIHEPESHFSDRITNCFSDQQKYSQDKIVRKKSNIAENIAQNLYEKGNGQESFQKIYRRMKQAYSTKKSPKINSPKFNQTQDLKNKGKDALKFMTPLTRSQNIGSTPNLSQLIRQEFGPRNSTTINSSIHDIFICRKPSAYCEPSDRFVSKRVEMMFDGVKKLTSPDIMHYNYNYDLESVHHPSNNQLQKVVEIIKFSILFIFFFIIFLIRFQSGFLQISRKIEIEFIFYKNLFSLISICIKV